MLCTVQESHQQRQTISVLQREVDSLRGDNVKLYEKIKFLQSYPGTVRGILLPLSRHALSLFILSLSLSLFLSLFLSLSLIFSVSLLMIEKQWADTLRSMKLTWTHLQRSTQRYNIRKHFNQYLSNITNLTYTKMYIQHGNATRYKQLTVLSNHQMSKHDLLVQMMDMVLHTCSSICDILTRLVAKLPITTRS